MCGRYAISATAGELIEHLRLLSCPEFSARYNITPTSTIPIIRYKPDAGRVGQLVRWGLIPSRTVSLAKAPMLNNARGESVHEKPSFRSSFAKHRCLIPASGFYEWKTVAGKKVPYYIPPSTPDTLFAFAGILAAWTAPDGQVIVTTCIITQPNEVMEPIHDRMPVILAPEHHEAWLAHGNNDIGALRAFLRPCNPSLMAAYQVSTEINSGRAEGRACIDPIPGEETQ